MSILGGGGEYLCHPKRKHPKKKLHPLKNFVTYFLNAPTGILGCKIVRIVIYRIVLKTAFCGYKNEKL